MKKAFIYSLPILVLAIGLALLWRLQPAALHPSEHEQEEEGIKEALEYQFEITKDPALGYPPTERIIAAVKETRRRQALNASRSPEGILDARWRERGPDNIGGRTRVILVDKSDPTRKTVWAGGVSGGLWKTTDITANPPQWQNVDDYLDNISIGALAQDPNNLQVMYMGTGELYTGIPGLALFKSVNGGQSWNVLPSTLNGNFRYTQDMFVHPQTGDVYAATSSGLWRSQDEGSTWNKVLGSGQGASGNTMHDVVYHKDSGTMFASNNTAVYKTLTGNPGDWQSVTAGNGFMTGVNRVEIAVSQGTPYYLYAIGNTNGQGTGLHTLANGEGNWASRAAPVDGEGTNYARDQGWYDLEVAADPFTPQHVIIGGIDLYATDNGGLSWQRISNWTGGSPQYVHADQHVAVFDEELPGVVYFGCDGGIFRATNGGLQAGQRNKGYNVTQFYACAIHPEAFKDHFLGGTQDNGSLLLDAYGIDDARTVGGGDGFYTHIDQNEPNFQMISLYYGNYSASYDGGASFGAGVEVNGGFVNPSDFDNDANILYAQTFDGDLARWKRDGGGLDVIDIVGYDVNANMVFADPTTPNRVYVGTSSGLLVRLDNAHQGTSLTPTVINPPSGGSVSSLDVDLDNPSHLLMTVSNYGLPSVYESINGGQSWVNVEGDLPDMPVYWGMFNPGDSKQAIIATELGIWATELISGSQTSWSPPVQAKGTPLTRFTMLQRRESDKVVLASSYGRGMWTSDLFATPTAVLTVDRIHYQDSPLQFVGERSLQAESFSWSFGDGATSTEPNPVHTYSSVGTYTAALTINGNLTTEAQIKILPKRSLPYTPEGESYSGSFEQYPEQYGVYTVSGSAFEQGKSTITGKDGAHSGNNAFVTGLTEQYYQPNTQTILYLPNFDFSAPGIYEFSFWAKYQLDPGFDGLQVQYSTNRGQSWRVLGSNSDPNWYNFRNDNASASAFPSGSSYFSGTRFGFTQYRLNVSNLGGSEDVAFRFLFRSNDSGSYPGLALDDVEITRYEGELLTKVNLFEGAYNSSSNIELNWSTLPEFYCKYFEVEQSFNGKNWEMLDKVNATGGTTSNPQAYEFTTLGQRNLYFFRLHVINQDEASGYEEIFYTDPIVVRRQNFYEGIEVLRVLPNPFTDYLEATFTDVLKDEPITYELFDAAGHRLQSGTQTVSGTLLHIDTARLPAGMYVLSITIGEGAPQSFKVLSR
ncbi:MAG: PKD domain-containing protein [Phaeodactylibacter sp.]|nr:PKD domain-containing protein [Phaeodactylibacter sp.]MCB9276659.1 PKD domain-containing protein [Lewinellaceae bacterium]